MVTTASTIETIEQRLSELRRTRDDLTTAIAVEDANLTAAVAAAQAVYDVAVVGKAAPPPANPHDQWRDDPKRDEETRERIRRAEGLFEQADKEFGAALVARTKAAQRRGLHLTLARQVAEEIERTERDLEEARREPERQRDLLQDIKARILGRPEPAA